MSFVESIDSIESKVELFGLEFYRGIFSNP